MGIKIKKKKKFRKWQKNSGANFEKGGAIMDWWTVMKNESKYDIINIIELVINDIKGNEFYDETVRLGSGSYMGKFANDLLEGKDIEEAALEMLEYQMEYVITRDFPDISEEYRIISNLTSLKEKLEHLKFMLEGYQPTLQKLVKGYADILSHPDWNSEMLYSNDVGFYRESRKIFEGIEEGKINETTPVKNFVDFFADAPIRATCIHDIWSQITGAIGGFTLVYKNLSKKRSLGLFESMAETMGVEIRYERDRPTFDYGGLNFKISGRNELVIDAGNTKITVCIVSSNPDLPIGDYYTSLIGLIVARPTELDVLDFAIKLANIFKEYDNYWSQFKMGANIFTPFERTNSENSGFVNLIELLHQIEKGLHNTGARPAREMLEKIQNALIDVFGSTRGFF